MNTLSLNELYYKDKVKLITSVKNLRRTALFHRIESFQRIFAVIIMKILSKISSYILICFILFLFTPGCGVIVGTIVDTATNVVTYPIKEYVFLGSYKYDNSWDEPYVPMPEKKDLGDVILGIAVSGGGSRSAYFMACVMEELSKIPIEPGSSKTYLDELDYISSVSGGSLASAYYCLMRYHPEYAIKEDFFKKFKETMSMDFQWRTLIRYGILGRWFLDTFTYYDRGDLLAGIWDDLFFHDMTFEDLKLAERNGSPTLLINGTNMHDGSRFVFSTLPIENYNQCQYLKEIRNASLQPQKITNYQSLKGMGFKHLNSDIRPYRISKAVIASAAVPNLLGPVTLRNYTDENQKTLINIVDGGVYDNYGVETLFQVIGEILDKNPGKKAKILLIDGSGYFQKEHKTNDSYTVADYSSRPLEISWMRNKMYVEYIWQKAKSYSINGIRPYKNVSFNLLSLYNIELPSQERAKTWNERDIWQIMTTPNQALENIQLGIGTNITALEKLVNIPTSFALSQKDAISIEQQAKQVVKTLLLKQNSSTEPVSNAIVIEPELH